MKFVIDTNIILSALIKDSITREILVTSSWNFYYPEIALHEIRKYKELVLKKSELQEQKYEDLLNKLMNCVILVPEEPIKQHLDEADAEFKKLNEIVGQQLNEGKENTKEMQLLKSIKQKRDIIKANPFYGDNIEKKKIPKEYNVQNL